MRSFLPFAALLGFGKQKSLEQNRVYMVRVGLVNKGGAGVLGRASWRLLGRVSTGWEGQGLTFRNPPSTHLTHVQNAPRH